MGASDDGGVLFSNSKLSQFVAFNKRCACIKLLISLLIFRELDAISFNWSFPRDSFINRSLTTFP